MRDAEWASWPAVYAVAVGAFGADAGVVHYAGVDGCAA